MDIDSGKHGKAVTGKILGAAILACAAVVLTLFISRLTFTRVLNTVDELSTPDHKIQLVNQLFRDIVQLDQMQRQQSLKEELVQYNPFLRESAHIQVLLDSLKAFDRSDSSQIRRIDAMKRILYRRDILFLKYIRLHAQLVRNDTLADQARALSELLGNASLHIDSNLVKASHVTRTITDTLQQEEKRQSLLKRIFAKRHARKHVIQRHIDEHIITRLDTVRFNNNNDSLARLGKALTHTVQERRSNKATLLTSQKDMNKAGGILIAQLVSLLDDIQHSELSNTSAKNAATRRVIDNAITGILVVLVLCVAGAIALTFLILIDISRSNKYRKELIVAREEAEEAGRVKQRFLANMSHELRTPLQTIIGLSEQVKDQPNAAQQDLVNIHQSSLHLLHVVNEVLDYSRITSGKFILERKPFSMKALLDEVTAMIRVQLDAKQLYLEYNEHLAANDFYSGDAFRLKQLLLNLLGNAVKFTDKGGITFTVSRQHSEDGMFAFTFTIADTGIGIAAKDAEVIFNQFEQGSASHARRGTGLGLSIVKSLVEQQGGTISLVSEPGKGSTFTMQLSYPTIAAPADIAVHSNAATLNFSDTIWVVDDDRFILQLCSTILTKFGIAHTCFSSATEVLSAPIPAGLAIVFLDIRLGDASGLDLCRKLRARISPAPIFIALTAQALPDERETILKHGFDDILMKPFLEQGFLSAIATHRTNADVVGDAPAIHLDFSVIQKMTGNDPALIKDILHSFVEETRIDMDTLRKARSDNDPIAAADTLHRLASRCGMLGVNMLIAHMRSIEAMLRAGSTDFSPLHDICSQVSAIVTSVNRHIV